MWVVIVLYRIILYLWLAFLPFLTWVSLIGKKRCSLYVNIIPFILFREMNFLKECLVTVSKWFTGIVDKSQDLTYRIYAPNCQWKNTQLCLSSHYACSCNSIPYLFTVGIGSMEFICIAEFFLRQKLFDIWWKFYFHTHSLLW